ncbi:MAG: glycosyltransferase [Actinobacteria bacterium]|nr:glycosyltransferase [Actinomycetota bacterium]
MILKNVSFIITILNEEKDISAFLDSLFEQSALPEEIVIVDGGSTDNTVDILSNYFLGKAKDFDFKLSGNIMFDAPDGIVNSDKNSSSIKIKIFQIKGVRISEGRNFAIKNTSGETICVSDSGCILDKDWFLQITKPFQSRRELNIVSGYNYAIAKNFLQSCLAASIMPKKEEIKKEKYMPSSRNLSFKKNAWLEVGGYPETMDYGEDMKFNFNLRSKGYEIDYNPEAVVYWKMRDNLAKIFKQFFRYAKGDALGKMYLYRHLIRFFSFMVLAAIIVLSVVLSPWFLLILIVLFTAYSFKPYSRINYIWDNPKISPYIVLKKYGCMKKILSKTIAIFFIPFLLIYIDLAKLSGYIYGLFYRKT